MKKSVLFFSLSFFLLFNARSALAFTCNSSGLSIGQGGSETPVTVYINFDPIQSTGKAQLLTVGQIQCTSDKYQWIDYLYTDKMDNVLDPSVFPDIAASLVINGQSYTSPVPAGIEVLQLSNYATKKLDLNVFITLKKKPSNNIVIKRGSVVAELRFQQKNNQEGCPQCGPYRWKLRALNDVVIMTNTCTINNGKQIDVDFGIVRRDLIATAPGPSLYSKDQPLTFNCEESDLAQDIKVTLIGTTPTFSKDLISTNNPDIGFAMMYKGKVVPPGGSFNSSISSSVGNDTIAFMPVRSSNVDQSAISTGTISGSATLLLSAP